MPSIKAISYFLPEKTLTNEDFFAEFPEARGTSLEKVGVKVRHLIAPDETAADLAFLAAEKLFDEHRIDRACIDFLVLCTNEPDYYSPSSACVLQDRLGLSKNSGAFDYNLGCSAYPYGLGIASGMIETMGAENVLLLTPSVLSRKIHPRDRASRFVFGDAAAATLIVADSNKKFGPFVYGTDGSGKNKIIIPHSGSRHPISPESFTEQTDEYGNVTSPAHLCMDGASVFLFTMRTVPKMINDLLAKAALTIDDIDCFVFHQANVYMNETLRRKTGIPEEKFVHFMDYGNTVQSSIPIAMYEAEKRGQLKKGMRVLVAGFGSGLSWAANIIEY